MTTFGTNFIFFVTKILTFVNEIFRWKTPSVTKFYFIKENFGRRNKIFVTKLLTTGLGWRTRHERIFVGECFLRRNLDFQWQNILSLKVNFLVVTTPYSRMMSSPSTTTMVSHAFCHMSMQLALPKRGPPLQKKIFNSSRVVAMKYPLMQIIKTTIII